MREWACLGGRGGHISGMEGVASYVSLQLLFLMLMMTH